MQEHEPPVRRLVRKPRVVVESEGAYFGVGAFQRAYGDQVEMPVDQASDDALPSLETSASIGRRSRRRGRTSDRETRRLPHRVALPVVQPRPGSIPGFTPIDTLRNRRDSVAARMDVRNPHGEQLHFWGGVSIFTNTDLRTNRMQTTR